MYLWVDEWWQPWANTLLYMPLSSNANDVQWHTTTTGGSVTFGTYWGVECADFTGVGNIDITPFAIPASYTVLARCNNVNGYDNTAWRVFDMGNPRLWLAYNNQGYYTYENNSYFWTTTKNARFLICAVVTNGSGVGYLKGNGVNQTSTIDVAPYSLTPSAMNVGNEFNNGANRHFLGYISNVIVENKARTAQEVADYYNQTKWNYWIS